MTLLALNDAAFVARSPLFQNLTLNFGPGDRVGLVALNGAGKTTLLRCLAGELALSRGEITRSRAARVGIVPQEVTPDLQALRFRDAVLGGLPVEARSDEAWRADMVLGTLEAPDELHDRPVAALSGGWQRLMLLARAWVGEPDVLLLDEPTNHLDLERILQLETWLNTWAGDALVVVASHDRSFLDAVTNRTLFLRPEVSQLFPLPYSQARVELDRLDAADAAKQARDLKDAQRLRRQSAKLKNIGVNSGSDLLLKKQKQLRERAEKIEDAATALHKERAGEIRLANRDTHSKALLRIADLAVTTPDGRPLFTVPELVIRRGERIVLLGRNGTGKSSLIRLLRAAVLAGEEAAKETAIKTAPTLVPGFMDQALSDLPLDAMAFEFISRFDIGDGRARAALATAGIVYEQQRAPIRSLSLGQRARLMLLALRFTAPNFYLLDEPTNHLDIAGQEVLAEEIQGASCVLVSHDRTFVREVGTRFLVIEGRRLAAYETPEPYFDSLTT